MSNLPLRYDVIEPDRRSELQLLDKQTLIEKVVDYEAQILFDPVVLVDEVSDLVKYLETRRRVLDYVARTVDGDSTEKKRVASDLLNFLQEVTQ